MNPSLFKFIVLVASIFFIILNLTIFTAELCYQRSIAAKEWGISFLKTMSYIDAAITLIPINSEYYYQKYSLLNDKYKNAKWLSRSEKIALLDEAIAALRLAIELEPSKASYHMFYALTLIKKQYLVNDAHAAALVKDELRKACELKPFSKAYQEIYNKFIPRQ